MTDRRLLPANVRVAHASVAELAKGATIVDGQPARVGRALVDLLDAPDGARDRQLLFGEAVTVLEDHDGWSFLMAEKDGYVGYVRSDSLTADTKVTHRVSAPATHAYRDADIKSPDLMRLSHGALVSVTEQQGPLSQTPVGFIPTLHLTPVDTLADDPVEIAELFLGTPYLWGGNSRDGIDCSGLVQAALLTCGIRCPGDSDLQEHALGQTLDADAPLRRGDLVFWKGHVALVRDDSTLIHANGHHMSVVVEDTEDAIGRIDAQGGGSVTSRKRL